MVKIFIFLVVLVIALVGAQRPDVIRRVRVVRGPPAFPHAIELLATRANTRTGDGDALRFLFTTNWIPRHSLGYLGRHDDTAAAFFARWSLWKLVEYSEDGTSEGLNPQQDEIIKSYRLWLRNWSNLTLTQEPSDPAPGESVLYSLCTQHDSADPRFSGLEVEICLTYSTQARTRAGRRFNPNRVKWSFRVNGWPYNSTESILALKVGFDSRSAIRESTPDEAGVEEGDGVIEGDRDGNTTLVMSWIRSATVTGNACSSSADVIRSIIFDGQASRDFDQINEGDPDGYEFQRNVRITYFSFVSETCQGEINWDPEMGVDQLETEDSGAVSVAASWLLTLFSLFFSLKNL